MAQKLMIIMLNVSSLAMLIGCLVMYKHKLRLDDVNAKLNCCESKLAVTQDQFLLSTEGWSVSNQTRIEFEELAAYRSSRLNECQTQMKVVQDQHKLNSSRLDECQSQMKVVQDQHKMSMATRCHEPRELWNSTVDFGIKNAKELWHRMISSWGLYVVIFSIGCAFGIVVDRKFGYKYNIGDVLTCESCHSSLKELRNVHIELRLGKCGHTICEPCQNQILAQHGQRHICPSLSCNKQIGKTTSFAIDY